METRHRATGDRRESRSGSRRRRALELRVRRRGPGAGAARAASRCRARRASLVPVERFFPAETYPEAQEALLSHYEQPAAAWLAHPRLLRPDAGVADAQRARLTRAPRPEPRRRAARCRALIAIDGAAGRRRRPDPAHRARALRGHRPGLRDHAGSARAARVPGLRPQHLAAVRAAALVCGARGGRRLRRLAGPPLRAGRGRGRATSASRSPPRARPRSCCRRSCPPLATAAEAEPRRGHGRHPRPRQPRPSTTWPATGRRWWRAWASRCAFELVRAGFYPPGGGEVRAPRSQPWSRPARARPRGARARSWRCAGRRGRGPVKGDVARRQARGGAGAACGRRAGSRVDVGGRRRAGGVARARSCSSRPSSRTAAPPSASWASAGCGRRSWATARRARLLRFLDGEGAVDPHLADQLAVPLALVRRRRARHHERGDRAPRDGGRRGRPPFGDPGADVGPPRRPRRPRGGRGVDPPGRAAASIVRRRAALLVDPGRRRLRHADDRAAPRPSGRCGRRASTRSWPPMTATASGIDDPERVRRPRRARPAGGQGAQAGRAPGGGRGGRLYLKGSVAVVTALEVVADGERFWFQVPVEEDGLDGRGRRGRPARPSDRAGALLRAAPRRRDRGPAPEPLAPRDGETVLLDGDREAFTLTLAAPGRGRGGRAPARVRLDRETLRPVRLRALRRRAATS